MSSSAAPEVLEVQVLIVTVEYINVFKHTGYHLFTTVNLHYLIGLYNPLLVCHHFKPPGLESTKYSG